MAIKSITSGTGFTSLTNEESAQGTQGTTGHEFDPIARWTHPPYSVYRDDVLHVGLMTYHSDGIKEVEFILNGGTGVKVTEQEINPDTNLPEYCVRIDRSELLGVTAEGLNNLELRAIVRPITGQVKIMQHDWMGISADGASACRAADMGFMMADPTGISGGYGTAFANTRLRPGKHGYVASLLQNNYEDDGTTIRSSIPNKEKYVSPSGSDGTGTGTITLPYKTMQKAMESIRDDADTFELIELNGQDVPTVRFAKNISPAKVIFLEGEYGPNEYRVADLGSGNNSSAPAVMSIDSWFVIEGVVDTDGKLLTVFSVPDNESRNIDPNGLLYSPNHPSNPVHVNILSQNKRLGNINVKNIHLKRNNLKAGQGNVGVIGGDSYLLATPDSPGLLNRPTIDGVWFDGCLIEEQIINGPGYSSLIPSTASVKATIATNCNFFGGNQNVTAFRILVNNNINGNGGDVIKQWSLSAGNQITNGQTSLLPVRKIWFDEPEVDSGFEDYRKFNGYYIPHRDVSYLKDKLSDSKHDGLEFSSSSGVATIWQKIKRDTINGNWGPNDSFQTTTEWIKDLTDPSNKEKYTYEEQGSVWNNVDGTYLPDENYSFEELVEHIGPYSSVPVLTKPHMILPHKRKRKYWYGEGIDKPNETLGPDIMDEILEDMCMALVDVSPNSLDNTTGATLSGYALFDLGKPLVRGGDQEPLKQNYLWRFSGSTTNAGNHSRNGGQGNFYDKKSGSTDKTTGYPYSWATGIVSVAPPNSGHDKPSSDIAGSTNDNYPIWSLANHGEEDGTHEDMYQLFFHNTWYDAGEVRMENILAAYDTFYDINSALWNMDTPSFTFGNESWRDIAFVNNVLVGPNHNYGILSGTWSVPTQNLLFLNNTITNNAVSLRFGNNLFTDLDAGTTGSVGISAGNAYDGLWGDYLENAYAHQPHGASFDRMTKNVVWRNNVISTVSGDIINLWANGGGRNDGYTGSSDQLRFERNYFWPYSTDTQHSYTLMENAGASAGGFKKLPYDDGYQWENQIPEVGGLNYDPTKEINMTPHYTSGLVGGATDSVPFDIYRTKRLNRSTAGAAEPNILRDYWNGSVNFVSLGDQYDTTSKTLSLDNNEEANRFGKLFRVVAIDTDTNAVVGVSENALMFENRYDDLTLIDSSASSTYEFTKNTGRYGKATYTPASATIEGVEILSTTDWLPVEYNLDRILIYPQTYDNGTRSDLSSIVQLIFPDNTAASAFNTAYSGVVSGRQIEFTFRDPEGGADIVYGLSADSTLSFFGGGPVAGNNVRYLFNLAGGSEGEDSPQGSTVEIGSNFLPNYPVDITNPI